MKPDDIAKSGSEHSHQAALFAWCAIAHLHGFAIANAWADEGIPALKKSPRHDAPDAPPSVPELAWYHAIPNGGSRGDTAVSARIQGGKMKAEGVKAGVVDTFLPVRRGSWPGLYIEMKKPGAITKVSAEQVAFMEFVKLQGYGVAVCDHWRKAADVLTSYLTYK